MHSENKNTGNTKYSTRLDLKQKGSQRDPRKFSFFLPLVSAKRMNACPELKNKTKIILLLNGPCSPEPSWTSMLTCRGRAPHQRRCRFLPCITSTNRQFRKLSENQDSHRVCILVFARALSFLCWERLTQKGVFLVALQQLEHFVYRN